MMDVFGGAGVDIHEHGYARSAPSHCAGDALAKYVSCCMGVDWYAYGQ